MNAMGLSVLSAVLLCGAPEPPAPGDLPPAAKEVLTQFEKVAAEIENQAESDARKGVDQTLVELKKVQDSLCKEAKLDEAVAVRDLIRALRDGTNRIPSDLPAAAKEVLKQHEDEVAGVHKKAEAEFNKRMDKTLAELKKVQDAYCKEAKLDEAVAVRDLIRAIRGGATNALADPGYVNNQAADIGKVFYYEVTGVDKDQSIYGSDVYTTGSHLGMAAVHTGVLKTGQKGIVKVTILPGQDNYTASTRRGITSYAYGQWGVSFKVERVYGFVGKLPVAASPELGR
jgi:F0F1-type ATP synthase membrane subunit b/b'